MVDPDWFRAVSISQLSGHSDGVRDGDSGQIGLRLHPKTFAGSRLSVCLWLFNEDVAALVLWVALWRLQGKGLLVVETNLGK